MSKSWDFWDTLVTRAVLDPHHVFTLMEERLGLPGFRQVRVDAERRSRAGVQETTLARIYEFTPYSTDVRDKAKELELELEKTLAWPIRENVDACDAADVVLSDMYLSGDVLAEIGMRCGLPINRSAFHVSCDYGATKHAGDLFIKVLAPRAIDMHIGDNRIADVERPRWLGMQSNHYTGALPNALEERWASGAGDGPLFAGALRAARLAYPRGTVISATEWNLYAQIVAPILVAFVEWVLADAVSRGVRRIFFLARDGQVLKRIADELCASLEAAPGCTYLYGSRHAFHLPGYVDMAGSASWILERTATLTPRTIAERCGLETEELLKVLGPEFNFASDQQLSRDDLVKVEEAARSQPHFDQLLRAKSMEAYELALGYLRQEGFVGGPVAIVDAGWHARIQRSLDNILQKAGHDPSLLHGYYLGVSRKCVYESGERVHGYLLDPFVQERCREIWLDRYRGIVEFFLSADHASVRGFARQAKGIVPVGQDGPAESVDAVRARQDAVLAYARAYCAVRRAAARPLQDTDYLARTAFRELLEAPTKHQAALFASCIHTEQQVEQDFRPLVKRIGLRAALKGARNWSHGIWPEGSYALSGYLAIHRARRLASDLRRRFERKLK